MAQIKVLLVDDHQILRDGIKTVLNETNDILVVGEATNGREAIKLTQDLSPEIVIMDLAMPELNGIEATKMISRDYPDIRVIALSMHSDQHYVRGAFQAGARGYILKHSAAKELIDAIRMVNSNHTYLSKEISDIVIQEFSQQINIEAEQDPLSVREKEILQLIAEGKSTKDIAALLFVSAKTIEAHRKNIMDKLQIHTIPELTKYAIRTGLTSLDD